MEKDKILIGVPVDRKHYYNADVIQSLLKDNQIAYKKGDTFVLMKIETKRQITFINKIIKGVFDKNE